MEEENKIKKYLIRIVGIIIASVISAANLKIFIKVGNLFPGGFSGITVLLQRCAERYMGIQLPYSPIYYILNAFPIYIGFKYIGKKFTVFSMVYVFLSGILTDLIPTMPVTYDLLLICIFGGIIGGISGSILLGVDASGGGTDFISMYLSQKRGIDSFNIILGMNVVVLVIAGILFGWDKALYSIIYQYVSTQVLHVFYKKYQQDTLMVVTDFPEEVCMAIDEVTHHGATIIEAQGAYEQKKKYIVYSVVSGSESRLMARNVRIVDPDAFVNVVRSQEIGGRFYRAAHD